MKQQDRRSRIVPVRGIKNFRDLGGYPAAGGAKTRWNRLYRSGHLARLSRHDGNQFSELGIHTVVDFRTAGERKKEPDRLPDGSVDRVVELPMLDPADSPLLREMQTRMSENRFAGFDADALMRDTYRELATVYTESYRAFVAALVETSGKPVLWHCTGGKDRSGFAAAIVLKLLGADDETIMSDYLLSSEYADRGRRMVMAVRIAKGRAAADTIAQLFRVQSSWLAASLEAIDSRWGSFDSYRREALDLGDDDVAGLRRLYLE
jgi:protein-tyrosine phosphatase